MSFDFKVGSPSPLPVGGEGDGGRRTGSVSPKHGSSLDPLLRRRIFET